MNYAYPLKSRYVTSGFRTRKRPTHNGTDYRAKVGTPVYAAMDGVVATGSGHPAAGTWIEVRNGRDLAGYSHLSRRTVRPGQRVSAGDLIGYTGNTGNTTGPHLHFYIKDNGRYVNPVTFLKSAMKPKPKPDAPKKGMTTSDWMTKAEIRKWQRFLRTKYPAYRWSVKVKRGQLIAVDGIDGPQTQAWTGEFQKRTGLTPDEIAGPNTIAEAKRRGLKL